MIGVQADCAMQMEDCVEEHQSGVWTSTLVVASAQPPGLSHHRPQAAAISTTPLSSAPSPHTAPPKRYEVRRPQRLRPGRRTTCHVLGVHHPALQLRGETFVHLRGECGRRGRGLGLPVLNVRSNPSGQIQSRITVSLTQIPHRWSVSLPHLLGRLERSDFSLQTPDVVLETPDHLPVPLVPLVRSLRVVVMGEGRRYS